MKKNLNLINFLAFAIGLGFLFAIIAKFGWDKVWSYMDNVGWGFALLLLTHLVAAMSEVAALKVALGGGVPYRKVFAAALAGAAINSLTPTGEMGEPIKANMLAPFVPMKRIVSSLVIWNFIYKMVKYLIVFVGPLVVFLFEPGKFSNETLLLMSAATIVGFVPTFIYGVAIWKGVIEILIKLLAKLPVLRRKDWTKTIESARIADLQVAEFASGRRGDAMLMCGFIAMSHISVIIEIWLALRLVGAPITVPVAFFLFSGNTVVATMVAISPVQLGVAEGGQALLFKLIGLDVAAGFTQAVVRRVKQLIYVVVGLSFLAWFSFRKSKAPLVIADKTAVTAPVGQKSDEPVKSEGERNRSAGGAD